MNSLIATLKLNYAAANGRRQILTTIVVGIVLVALILLYASMSLDQNQRLVVDLGLAGITLISLVSNIISTTYLFLREQERGVLLLILPKPISQTSLIVGKYLGLVLAALTNYLLLSLIVVGVSRIFYPFPLGGIALALLVGFGEIAVIIALAVLFSSLTAPLLAAFLTFASLVIGHSLSLIATAADRLGGFTSSLGQAVYYLAPNLEKFNLREMTALPTSLPTSYYGWLILYALAYIAFSLTVAVIIFRRREW